MDLTKPARKSSSGSVVSVQSRTQRVVTLILPGALNFSVLLSDQKYPSFFNYETILKQHTSF